MKYEFNLNPAIEPQSAQMEPFKTNPINWGSVPEFREVGWAEPTEKKRFIGMCASFIRR